MLNLNSLLLFSETPKKLVDFYRKILALEPNGRKKDSADLKLGVALW